MSEIIKLNKEINGKTKNGVEYKVNNLEINNSMSRLFGTLTIKKESKDFYIDFSNESETEWNFQKIDHYDENPVEDKFTDALDDFCIRHTNESIVAKIDKNQNMVIERTINIE